MAVGTSFRAMMAAAGAATDAVYVEDVFAASLYTGNASSNEIDNGLDLSGDGGLVWIKQRTTTGTSHRLFDTERGVTKCSAADNNTTEVTVSGGDFASFDDNGFTLATPSHFSTDLNGSGGDYVAWSFKNTPGFFEVLTWTGDGNTGREIPHNLGSTPVMIFAKRRDAAGNWYVYHQNLSATANVAYLDLTDGESAINAYGSQTSSNVVIGSNAAYINNSGSEYVAYVFAADNVFGADGDEYIAKAGVYTTDGSGNGTAQSIGFEPDLILIKRIDSAEQWVLADTKRGLYGTPAGGVVALHPDSAGVEGSVGLGASLNPNGFTPFGSASGQYIYYAIRRPMKIPTAGSEVFYAATRSGTSSAGTVTGVGFSPDWVLTKETTPNTLSNAVHDRLRGPNKFLQTDSTAAEVTSYTNEITSFDPDGISFGVSSSGQVNGASGSPTFLDLFLKRATGFFDMICYNGDGNGRTQPHNLGVVPELIIVKPRNNSFNWGVYQKDAPDEGSYWGELVLNDVNYWGSGSNNTFPDTAPTASVFSLPGGTASASNRSGWTYVAYLFATLAGVSKVGTYTGTGADQNIDCGFASGAAFVLIKNADAFGDWYLYDTTRGIVAGNDPFIITNDTDVENTSTDYIDPYSAGFALTAAGSSTINVSSQDYIYLAIAA